MKIELLKWKVNDHIEKSFGIIPEVTKEQTREFVNGLEESLRNFIVNNGIDKFKYADVVQTDTIQNNQMSKSEKISFVNTYSKLNNYNIKLDNSYIAFFEVEQYADLGNERFTSTHYYVFMCSNDENSRLPVNKIKDYL